MSPAESIGHYRIVSKLGEGGMGAVYRATDTKLKREVALKVLPPEFAADTARMVRFEREAQVLASLNHPNIAAIYGVEQGAIVMELVEGPDLAGPVSLETAIDYARQIAAGLEAAHDRGIIHRDLKPANIKVTPDGVVKLLDFGLAKATEQSAVAANPSTSPTQSLAMTQAGVILGTAAYMSPEQAKGKPVDRRADIWAFGVILFELLTGKHLYADAETVTEALAAVVLKDPDFAALPVGTPERVRRLLERCLRKDPRQRMRDIGEARLTLDEIEPQPPAAAPAARRTTWPWLATGICGLSLAILAPVHFRETPPRPPAPIRFEIAVPPSGSVGRFITVSPDGQTLAWADGGNIYVRAIDGFEPRVLTPARVDGYMFWSPDGKQLGFQAEGKLRRIPVAGGPVQTICEITTALGTVWTTDGRLIIGGSSRGLLHVPISGGTPQVVEVSGGPMDVISANWPVLLPGAKKLLYVINRSDRPAAVIIADLQPDGKLANPREVVNARHGAQYFTDAAGRGYLLFVRGTSLLAQAFDPLSAAVSGDSIVITDAVGIYLTRAFFAAANGGTIVFRNGETVGTRPELVDRSGNAEVVKSLPASLMDLTVSPDGGRILTTSSKADGLSSIWILDPQRGAHTRVTFDDVSATRPIWSPDGKRIAYAANGLWVKPANGSGVAEKLAPPPIIPWSWSHDGKQILVSLGEGGRTQPGLFLLTLNGDRKPVPCLTSNFTLSQAQFSPDDRWVAYVSDESGDAEVYVQRFPPTGERIRISIQGGIQPRWRRDGGELFYVEPRGKLMAVALRYGKTLEADVPVPLFDARLTSFTTGTSARYDVTADGKHFYISRFPEAQSTSPLRVILNWPGAAK